MNANFLLNYKYIDIHPGEFLVTMTKAKKESEKKRLA